MNNPPNLINDTIARCIYQKVDGFYYFDPQALQGAYPAHLLRAIADMLDEMNKRRSELMDAHPSSKCATIIN